MLIAELRINSGDDVMALDSRTKTLIDQGQRLFDQRTTLMALNQEIAELFYPERAQFTAEWRMGRNFADNLTTSFPIMVRRDLANTFSGMTRPSDQDWFAIGTNRPDREDDDAKKWLERSTITQRNAMYDPVSGYIRGMKEADHDFAAFGERVVSCVLNRVANGLVIKCWHLRDMAWGENDEGVIDIIRRKWKPTARDLKRMFPDGIAESISKAADKEPFREIQCLHAIQPMDQYEPPNGKKKTNAPYMSIFIDQENGQIMQERPSTNTVYGISRWETVSNSQYAYSPATIASLPDARLAQAITLLLLESGEKAISPPMVAPADTIRSDIQLYANGITIYDPDYDEKTGEVLRAIPIQTGGMEVGFKLLESVKQALSDAHYLNKIGLPPIGRDMTAFEVGQRVSEYVRNALPLFQPLEADSAKDNELIFDVMRQAGGFGSPLDIPDSIKGADIRFKITSPLAAAIDAQKVNKFDQALAMTAQGAQVDPTAPHRIKWPVAYKDALEGNGTPASWMNSDEDMAEGAAAATKQAALQQQIAGIASGADAANKVGQAAQSMGILPSAQQRLRQGVPQPGAGQ